MSSKVDLHIVSFDIPYPADYGGVIDVYYKLEALKKEGVSVALHCFHNGRSEAEELKKYCAEVNYYPRRSGLMAQFSATPYIIASRNDKTLLNNLLKDDAPILFEGLHTTYFLGHPNLKNRRTAVRVHNREDQYYEALYQQTNSFYKKTFYGIESRRLKYFEKRLSHAEVLFCLSQEEQRHYNKIHKNSIYLPVFHPYKSRKESAIKHQLEQAIYFGNLAVEENSKAVEFLIQVFEETPYSLKVSGRGIGSSLLKKLDQAKQAEYLGELSDSDLKRFINESKVCCLPTFQSTGIKLKFVQALFQANEIILNKAMLADESFADYCLVAEEAADWRQKLKQVFSSELNEEKIKQRIDLVKNSFDNQKSARQLAEWCAQAQ